jgi:hypothetical protein
LFHKHILVPEFQSFKAFMIECGPERSFDVLNVAKDRSICDRPFEGGTTVGIWG